MSRRLVHEDKKKVKITLRIRKDLCDSIKKIPGYNPIVENLIEEYLKKINIKNSKDTK